MPRNHTGDHNADTRDCSSGGPLFFFQAGDVGGEALALSAITHFSSQAVVNCPRIGKGQKPPAPSCSLGVSAAVNIGCKDKCLRFATSSMLLARPGITRTARAFGAALRRFHNTSR
jgi:hypothetical protein